MPSADDLRRLRHTVAVHEAGHAAVIIAMGAGAHITGATVARCECGRADCPRTIGKCSHHLGFPDTPAGRIAGTAVYLGGVLAVRTLLPGAAADELCKDSATLKGTDEAKVASFNATPDERKTAEQRAGMSIMRHASAILAMAEALVARGELSGDEVRAFFSQRVNRGNTNSRVPEAV